MIDKKHRLYFLSDENLAVLIEKRSGKVDAHAFNGVGIIAYLSFRVRQDPRLEI